MTFKKLLCSAALLLAFAVPQVGRASSINTAYISQTQTVSGGVMFIYLSVSHTLPSSPTCTSSSASTLRYLIPPSEKAMIAQALAAQAMGRSVSVGGTGVCDTAWNDTETVSYLTIQP